MAGCVDSAVTVETSRSTLYRFQWSQVTFVRNAKTVNRGKRNRAERKAKEQERILEVDRSNFARRPRNGVPNAQRCHLLAVTLVAKR